MPLSPSMQSCTVPPKCRQNLTVEGLKPGAWARNQHRLNKQAQTRPEPGAAAGEPAWMAMGA